MSLAAAAVASCATIRSEWVTVVASTHGIQFATRMSDRMEIELVNDSAGVIARTRPQMMAPAPTRSQPSTPTTSI